MRKTKKNGEPMKQTVDGEEDTVSWLHEVKDENQLENQQENKNKVAQQDDCEKQEVIVRFFNHYFQVLCKFELMCIKSYFINWQYTYITQRWYRCT